MRALIIKDSLEKLGCTVEEITVKKEAKEDSPKKQADEFEDIDRINLGTCELKAQVKKPKPLIIVDA